MSLARNYLVLICRSLLVASLILSDVEATSGQGAPVPALFIFGDSFVDSGNNNVLVTIAKANFDPYGRDFDTHQATGRFANGRLIPDFLASYLGIPFQPPFASAGDNILSGVNFASAGSGLYNTTGYIFGQHIPIPDQVSHFKTVKDKLESLVGVESASEIVSKSIYFFMVGSNDISNNYYVIPGAPIQRQFTPAQFQDLIVSLYSQQIQTLYSYGARKFVIQGLIPLGCTPITLLLNNVPDGECVQYLNQAAQSYNAAVGSVLSQLRSSLPGVQIAFANPYNRFYDIIDNPKKYGFTVTSKACCSGIGKNGAIIFCLQSVPTCKDVNQHLYWDEFHPSTAAYELFSKLYWSGSSDIISPMNVRDLAFS